MKYNEVHEEYLFIRFKRRPIIAGHFFYFFEDFFFPVFRIDESRKGHWVSFGRIKLTISFKWHI